MTHNRATAMPLKAKLVVAAVVLGSLTWLLADRQDRVANEDRLSAIATAIAEKPVGIDCPGPIGRLFSSTVYDGTVAFDADGGPAGEAKLGARTCAELDALADGDRSEALACADRDAACGEGAGTLARAVDVLAHESWHLAGIADEADTECRSLQTMVWAAQELGATEPEARRLALLQFEVNFPILPARYRSSACHDGGADDLRPDDPRWP
jgi:hypothetical protein